MDDGDARKHVFIEGFNPLPKRLGEKGGIIFGAHLYPDIIIRDDDGKKLAIEIDNGSKGSGIKNALSKAGMVWLTGDFVAVAEYYFAYKGLKMNFAGESEDKVMKFYAQNLRTRLFMV